MNKYTVMNIFQLGYETRLREWYELRKNLENSDTKTKCIEIDHWWQYAPLVNHYLHPKDTLNWPGPWDLIYDNNYCTIARGLGMCYTLLLLGVDDVDFCQGKDDNDEDVTVVLVDRAKYVMNYWPQSVISTSIKDFTITAKLPIQELKKKLK